MNEKRNHPTLEKLAAFAHGRLNATDVEAVETHVGGCDTCCDRLREIPHDELVDRLRTAGSTAERTEQYGPSQDARIESTISDVHSAIPRTLIDHPRYEVVKQLGAGGMGVVYLAQHRLMARTVALKVISGKLLKNAAAVERFRQEVKAAARLSHRNIVTAYDAEQAGDMHFLIMEFVAGTDLATIVKNRGRLPVMHACNYVMQAAQGLQHAHEQGMVHRDIKPQNLMVTPKGAVKILDFGLARLATHSDDSDQAGLTREGATLGTPDYISPEQARDSRRADIRSDIYSLGCTLYYLLAGVVPFPVGTPMDKVIAHCERLPAPLGGLRDDIPVEVVNIVQRMMAKDPIDRMQTPKEVVEALRPFAVVKPVSDPPLGIEATRTDAASPLEVLEANVNPGIAAPSHAQIDKLKNSRRQLGPLRRYRGPLLAGAVALALLAVAIPVGMQMIPDSDSSSNTTENGDDWQDMISQVDPVQHAVAGSWRRAGNELVVEPVESARLVLPAPPGPEYDFEIEFTRHRGTFSIAMMFVMGTGQATFEVDAWETHLAGFQMIDGRDMRENGTRVDIPPLENGHLYKLLVQVRRDQVQGFLDGKLLATYRGDGSNLSPLELWKLPDTRKLGLGAYQSATTFHRVRVRRVGG